MHALTGTAERRWLLWPPLVFLAVALGAPLAVLTAQALTGGADGAGGLGDALALPSFGAALLRTLVMALVVAVLTLVVGLLCALGLWAAPRWLAGILLGVLLLSLWTSVMVRSFGWVLLELPRGAIHWALSGLGLGDEPIELYQTAFAMYPAMVAVMLPFAVLPLLVALGSVHGEQFAAARVFGAGPVLVLRSVLMPALRPALISAGVLVLVMSLGFYVTPLLLGGPSNLTVSGLITLQLGAANRPEVAAAMSLLLVAGSMLLYLVSDRVFRVSERWGVAG